MQVKSPFLEAFLTRTSGAAASVRVLDLLWKHYERNNKHLAAAKVLAKLAERHGSVASDDGKWHAYHWRLRYCQIKAATNAVSWGNIVIVCNAGTVRY